MVTLGRQQIWKMFYNGQQIIQGWHGKQKVYQYIGYVPSTELPDDPHLNGIRMTRSITSSTRTLTVDGSYVKKNSGSTIYTTWGDGKQSQSSSGKGTHTYQANGSFTQIITSNGQFTEIEVPRRETMPEITRTFYSTGSMLPIPGYDDQTMKIYQDRTLTDLYIGDDLGIENMSGAMFTGATNLRNIRLPSTLKYLYGAYYDMYMDDGMEYAIQLGCFHGCTSLQVVDLRNCTQLLEIGGYSFTYCTSLHTVILPQNLNVIFNAFGGDINLKKIVCMAKTPPRIGNPNCFYNVGIDALIKVPRESIILYRGAPFWSSFESISEYDESDFRY